MCTGCASRTARPSRPPPPASATTLDTQLFLFDANGLGVYSNDDAPCGVRSSRLPSNHRFSPTGPGEYYLALSSFNNDPQSDAGEIFPDLFSTSLYPDMRRARGRSGRRRADRELERSHAAARPGSTGST